MAIIFKGITPGDRKTLILTVGTTSYTFESNYKERVESTRIESEKWNGSEYERIHRVIRAWKIFEFNTGKIIGTTEEAATFVEDLIKSTIITLQVGTTTYKVTLENSNLSISDHKREKGYSLDLMFKTAIEC